MSATVANFEYTNQNNESFTSNELEGEWWISYFFYTNCKMVCPQTTANIVNVQEELAEINLTPPIVGFSVDPDFDQPDILIDYAKEYGANIDHMTLLTGYEFDTIKKLANESFKTVLDSGGPDDHAYAHSTFFFLINPEGEVIKRYDGLSQAELSDLIEDAKKVM